MVQAPWAKPFLLFCDVLDKYQEAASFKLYQESADQKEYDKLKDECGRMRRQYLYLIGIGKPPDPFQSMDMSIKIKSDKIE